MKVCEWKFSFSFAYIREKFFFEFSSFYPRYVYYRFPRTRTAGRSVFSKTPIEPNMKKIRESCQTGLAKTWLCSSLRDKILPVNRNDNPRNQSISANRFQPRFRAIDYISIISNWNVFMAIDILNDTFIGETFPSFFYSWKKIGKN